MRILFVTPYIPSVVRVRPYHLIRTLAALGHQVHLVALQPPEDRGAPIDTLREACAQIDLFPLARLRTLWNAFTALPTRRSLQAAYSHHPQAERHLRQLVAAGGFDVLHVEHLRGAVLADGVRDIPRVWDSVDSIAFLFEQSSRLAPRLRQRLIARLDLGRTRHFEARAPSHFDRTLVTSPADAQALARLAVQPIDDRIEVVPNGVDLDYFTPGDADGDRPPAILFSGKMSYHANGAAALYLAREIMPRIWAQCPETQLLIVGKDPTAAVRALSEDTRVTVTGTVDDVRPYFRRATLSLAPMLYGAGIQNKVLEAMASGVPVVATPTVCNSLKVIPDQDILLGDVPDQLAAHAVRILKDPLLRRGLSRAGRQYVERHHCWADIVRRLVSIYEQSVCAPANSSTGVNTGL